jgi:hypothetical protein
MAINVACADSKSNGNGAICTVFINGSDGNPVRERPHATAIGLADLSAAFAVGRTADRVVESML